MNIEENLGAMPRKKDLFFKAENDLQ